MRNTTITTLVLAQSLATAALAGVAPLGFYGRRDFYYASNPADDGTIILTRDNVVGARWVPGQAPVPFSNVGGFTTQIAANSSRFAGIDSNQSFIYDLPSGPYQQLPRPPGSFVQANFARGISANGSVVVGNDDSVGAWKWTAAGGTQLLTPGNPDSSAYDISRDGTKSVGWVGNQPLVYTDATGPQAIPRPVGASRAEFRGISGDGNVAVGLATFPTTRPAVRWSESTGYQLLPTLPNLPNVSDQYFFAYSATMDGSVIVGTQSSRRAWIWDAAHGTRDLRAVLITDYGFDLTNWTLEQAFHISADGSMITGGGAYFNGSGQEFRTWAAVIPSPGGAVILGVGLITQRRRR